MRGTIRWRIGESRSTMDTSVGTISYTDEGSGPPILLLHATLHDRGDFAPVYPALAEGRRILALDWPGHGASPLPHDPDHAGAFEFGTVAEEFVDRLDLRNLVVVGNSVGRLCRMPAGHHARRPDRRPGGGQRLRVPPVQPGHPGVLRTDGPPAGDPHVVAVVRPGVHGAADTQPTARSSGRSPPGSAPPTVPARPRRCGAASRDPATTCVTVPRRSPRPR